MNFNFKNKNSIIILLLILLIASVFCFFLMQKKVEPFLPENIHTTNNVFKSLGYNINYEKHIYKLNDNNKTKAYKINTISSNINETGTIFESKINETSIIDTEYALNTNDLSFNMYEIINASGIYSNSNSKRDISYNVYKLLKENPIILDLSSTGAINETGNINILFLTDASGKVYDICNQHMNNFSLNINSSPIIENGILNGMTQTTPDTGGTTTLTDSSGSEGGVGVGVSGAASSSNASVGDIINNIVTGNSNAEDYPNLLKEYPYLLQYPSLLQSSDYFSPYYNNSFESMMSLPSDPLVNPNSAMNPLEYNQSLFGPNVTPMMAKKMCKNLNVDTKVSDISNNNNNNNNNINNNMFNTGSTGGGLTGGGLTGDGLTGGGSTGGDSNNLSADGTTNSHPPCPPCGRCPESNFECKKIPKYEQGYDNPVVPRAVLTDFSTFGM